MKDFVIREEKVEDIEPIRQVNRMAFGQDAEARLVDRLRADGLVVASLVAATGGRVIGHIMFSALTIEANHRVIRGSALAPMAVVPSHQRHGIGSALVRAGVGECRNWSSCRHRPWAPGLLPTFRIFGGKGEMLAQQVFWSPLYGTGTDAPNS